MEYAEALKRVQTKKPKENYMLIELSYDKKLLLPYKEGIALLATLVNAEQLNESYSKPKVISPLEREIIKSSILSSLEYEQIKIAALLNVSLDEVKQFELEAA